MINIINHKWKTNQSKEKKSQRPNRRGRVMLHKLLVVVEEKGMCLWVCSLVECVCVWFLLFVCMCNMYFIYLLHITIYMCIYIFYYVCSHLCMCVHLREWRVCAVHFCVACVCVCVPASVGCWVLSITGWCNAVKGAAAEPRSPEKACPACRVAG